MVYSCVSIALGHRVQGTSWWNGFDQSAQLILVSRFFNMNKLLSELFRDSPVAFR